MAMQPVPITHPKKMNRWMVQNTGGEDEAVLVDLARVGFHVAYSCGICKFSDRGCGEVLLGDVLVLDVTWAFDAGLLYL